MESFLATDSDAAENTSAFSGMAAESWRCRRI